MAMTKQTARNKKGAKSAGDKGKSVQQKTQPPPSKKDMARLAEIAKEKKAIAARQDKRAAGKNHKNIKWPTTCKCFM